LDINITNIYDVKI